MCGCQTIEKKTQQALKKENEKLSQYLGKSESELKIYMGNPDKIIVGEKGTKFFLYKSKKYSISCERKFEINNNGKVVAFSSKGCF